MINKDYIQKALDCVGAQVEDYVKVSQRECISMVKIGLSFMKDFTIEQMIQQVKQSNIKLAKQRCLEFNNTMFTDNPTPNKTWQEGYVLIVERFKQRPHWLAWCDLEAVIDTLQHEFDTLKDEFVKSDTQK